MRKYKKGEMIDTTVHGFITVQAPILFKENKNPKYDKLGGRTLYWLQNADNTDIFLWDTELQSILSDEEIVDYFEVPDETDYKLAGLDFEW